MLESRRMEMPEFIEARRPRWEQLESLLDYSLTQLYREAERHRAPEAEGSRGE